MPGFFKCGQQGVELRTSCLRKCSYHLLLEFLPTSTRVLFFRIVAEVFLPELVTLQALGEA